MEMDSKNELIKIINEVENSDFIELRERDLIG